MKNGKQWAKALMAIIIGALPLTLAAYTQATWYYTLLTICSLFLVLGIIALFQLFIYTVAFPSTRNAFVKTLFGLSIALSLTIPYFWIQYHESHPEQLLENSYEITDATITKTTPYGSDFLIEYTFSVKSKKYQSSKIVKKEPATSNLYIKYLPSDPIINKPAEE